MKRMNVLILFMILMLCLPGCSNETMQEMSVPEETSLDEDTLPDIPDNNSNWRQEYINVIDSWHQDDKDNILGYDFLYLDSDDIPELILYCYDDAWEGFDIYSMVEGKAVRLDIYDFDGEKDVFNTLTSNGRRAQEDSYIPKQGLMMQSGGQMGCYWVKGYMYRGGCFEQIFNYMYTDMTDWSDEATEPISYEIEYLKSDGQMESVHKEEDVHFEMCPELDDLETEYDVSFSDKELLDSSDLLNYDEVLSILQSDNPEETSLNETEEVTEEEASSSNGGKTIAEMVIEDYKLPDIPEDKLYLVETLTLPSREDIYYEFPWGNEVMALDEEIAYDNILNELAKLCISEGYTNCRMVDVSLDVDTLNYEFVLDGTEYYALYLFYEQDEVINEVYTSHLGEFEPAEISLANENLGLYGLIENRDITLSDYDYKISVSEFSDITVKAPLDTIEGVGVFDTGIVKAIQYFADTYIVDYNPESDFNTQTEAYSAVIYRDFHKAVIEIKGIPYEFVASDDGNHEFIYVTQLK